MLYKSRMCLQQSWPYDLLREYGRSTRLNTKPRREGLIDITARAARTLGETLNTISHEVALKYELF